LDLFIWLYIQEGTCTNVPVGETNYNSLILTAYSVGSWDDRKLSHLILFKARSCRNL